MKRPITWTLGLIGVLAGAAGILAGSGLFRAHLLLREQAELADRILRDFPAETTTRPAIFEPEDAGNAWELEEQVVRALDSNYPTGPEIHNFDRTFHMQSLTYYIEPPDPERGNDLDGQLDTLRRAFRRKTVVPGRRPGLESLHSFDNAVSPLIRSARGLHREGKDMAAAERLVMAVALMQDLARHGNFEHLSALQFAEQHSTVAAWEILSAHSMTAPELETWAKWMDRLRSTRPSLAQIIAVDGAVGRKDIVDDLANVAFYPSSPAPDISATWRDLWCRSLADCRTVLKIDRETRALVDRARQVPWLRGERGPGQPEDVQIFDIDAASQLHLVLWRVSIALAEYDLDHGKLPERLPMLVPRYLPLEPVSPRTGKSLDYDGQILSSDPGPGDLQKIHFVDGLNPDLFRWKVARKSR
jgi:hypothetical protein